MYPNLNKGSLLIERFKQDLEHRNFSPRSIRTYSLYVRQFFRYLGSEEKVDDLRQINKSVILRYQSYLYHGPIKLCLRSQQHKLVGLRSFFKYLERDDILLSDPTSRIELPRTPKTLPMNVLKEKEIEKILGTIDIQRKLGLRDRAIIEVLYSTAIRSFELTNLCLLDVDDKEGLLRITQGKGSKDRVVPIGQIALNYLRLYSLHERLRLLKHRDEKHIFLSSRGNPMDPGDIPAVVQRHAKRAGFKRHTDARLLRHTCATHMLRKGANIRLIQEMLGHESLNTTQIYTRVDIKDLKKVHRKTHPREI